MRKLDGILVMTIVVAVAGSSYSALAKGGKSTSNLLTNTATGKHYDKTTLTPHKPKTPITEQKASKKSGNIGKGPNDNSNSTGASAGKLPSTGLNPIGGGTGPAEAKSNYLKYEFKGGIITGGFDSGPAPPPPPPPPPPPK